MNLDILLENVQRKIEMKTKQDISMGWSMDYYEDDLYTGVDYDDDVFVTLNS